MLRHWTKIVISSLLVAGISVGFLACKAEKEEATTIQVINQSRWAQTIRQAVTAWNDKHPEQQVVLDQLIIGYPQLRNKLITAVGAGTPPDISILDSVWLSEFAQTGHLAALDELDPQWYERDYKVDFFPVFQKGDVFDGHLWGVRTQTDMAVLWYRKDWLAAEGLNPPATWRDIVKMGKHFKEKNVRNRYGNSKFPFALPLGQKARETLIYQLLPLFWSNGGGIFQGERLILNSPQNIETLNFLKDLVHTHRIVSPEAITFEWDRAMKLLATGKAVVALGGTYEKRMMQEVTGWNDDEFLNRVGYSLIPSGPGGEKSTTAGGMCYVVYKQSPNQQLAMEIAKLATSPAIMRAFLLETSQHPPRVSIAEGLDEEKQPFLAETAPYLYQARTRPNFPEYSRLSDLLQEMIERTVRGEVQASRAVRESSQEIRALMKQQ
jgi:multiple sugar transport system substrate-binding protein